MENKVNLFFTMDALYRLSYVGFIFVVVAYQIKFNTASLVFI